MQGGARSLGSFFSQVPGCAPGKAAVTRPPPPPGSRGYAGPGQARPAGRAALPPLLTLGHLGPSQPVSQQLAPRTGGEGS